MIKERFMNNKIDEVQYNQSLGDLQNLLILTVKKATCVLNKDFCVRQLFIITETVQDV